MPAGARAPPCERERIWMEQLLAFSGVLGAVVAVNEPRRRPRHGTGRGCTSGQAHSTFLTLFSKVDRNWPQYWSGRRTDRRDRRALTPPCQGDQQERQGLNGATRSLDRLLAGHRPRVPLGNRLERLPHLAIEGVACVEADDHRARHVRGADEDISRETQSS